MPSPFEPAVSPNAPVPPDGEVIRTAARAFERDRYLAALLAPTAARGDLIALAAFAGEVARIPAYVSEPMVGEIRLQWWRDTLEAGISSGEGDGGGHPIAVALIAAARRHGVSASHFIDVIDAQSQRLDDQPFATFDELLANVRAWDGGLFAIAGRMLGTEASDIAAEMPWQAGTVYGLSRVLLDTPVDLTQGRCLLPVDACGRHGATLGVALEPKSLSAFDFTRRDMVSAATPRLDVVRGRFQEAPRTQRIAALPLALVQPYLALCRTTDIAEAELRDIGPLKRVWRLWLTHRLGRLVD